MKPAAHQKSIRAAIIFPLAACVLSCAAESRFSTIQDIVTRWTVIEQNLVDGGEESAVNAGAGALDDAGLLRAADEFLAAIQSFRDSEMYRMYRMVPFLPDAKPAFGPSVPGELSEIVAVMDLAAAFRESLAEGERKKAALVSQDIKDALVRTLLLDGEAGQFINAAYLRLLLTLIVFIAVTAFALRLLYKALVRSLRREAASSRFSRASFMAQEEERSRLSRELHDTIAQDLRYLSLGMEKIGRTDERREREKLCAEAASMQSALIGKIRDICDYLVPPDFRFQGLKDALRRLCLDFGRRSNIDCRIDIAENINPEFLPPEEQLQVFRIAQEALTNVEKHAAATEAIVILRTDANGDILLGVSDDGKGFDASDGGNADGTAAESLFLRRRGSGQESGNEGGRETPRGNVSRLGIRGMSERAALLGGSLEIKSERGEGTMVRLRLPAKEAQHGSAVN